MSEWSDEDWMQFNAIMNDPSRVKCLLEEILCSSELKMRFCEHLHRVTQHNAPADQLRGVLEEAGEIFVDMRRESK